MVDPPRPALELFIVVLPRAAEFATLRSRADYISDSGCARKKWYYDRVPRLLPYVLVSLIAYGWHSTAARRTDEPKR